MKRGSGKGRLAVLALLTGLAVALALLADAGEKRLTGNEADPARRHDLAVGRSVRVLRRGIALGSDGFLYASITTWGEEEDGDVGQIVKIAPGTGKQTAFGPEIETPGLLTGVAFDAQGGLYVANATFSDEDLPGVFRIDAGQATRVLTLPANSFPNGLAIRDGYLYVSDSALGAVWRSPVKTASTPAAPWFQDQRLAPGSGANDHGIGANGIAFKGSDLYVAVADAGRIVRVAVLLERAPGALRTVSNRPELRSVDGIAFDLRGDLWITVNGPGSGRLLRLTTVGQTIVMADQVAWLDYPTQPVLGVGRWSGVVYVANGSFDGGTPNVVSLAGLAP